MKLLFSQVKPLVARVLGFCIDDARVASYTNEAIRRLLNKGLWAGCYGRFTIYTSDGCIVWPRMIETIESVATCFGVGQVRNQWFEFLEGGFGLQSGGTEVTPWGGAYYSGSNLLDKGSVCSYKEMSGNTTSKIRVYPGDASDAGKYITLQGYDQNGNWIRTTTGPGGAWIDGERIALAMPFGQTSNYFTSLTTVIREATNTVSRLYEYNLTTTLEIDIAVYDPDETLPEYRKSMMPINCTPTSGSTCGCTNDGTVPVTVMAKLRHIPVSQDNDLVIPPCPDAIKLMVQAIRKEENDLLPEAVLYEQKAVQTLQEQTMQYLGDAVAPIRMVGMNISGGGLNTIY
jgi:hypothetical protein